VGEPGSQWKVVLSPQAARAWRKLPSTVREAIADKIDWLARNMHLIRHERLRDREECSLHIGQYRILYTYDGHDRVIYVEALGKHNQAYR